MFRVGGEKIIIFDLDGTLANDDHRARYLHPPHTDPRCSKVYDGDGICPCGAKRDWSNYFARAGDDTPKPQVIQICKDLARWHQIYILSGRSESTADVTRKWLRQQEVQYDRLRLRGVDDRTQDDVLKIQWVEDMGIRDRVICIFEDRQRVVDAWRAAGYTCFQVAPGNF